MVRENKNVGSYSRCDDCLRIESSVMSQIFNLSTFNVAVDAMQLAVKIGRQVCFVHGEQTTIKCVIRTCIYICPDKIVEQNKCTRVHSPPLYCLMIPLLSHSGSYV